MIFVAAVVQTVIGQADRVAAARRRDGDAVGIGNGFVACGVASGGAAWIRYGLVARCIFNRNLGELDLVFGGNGNGSAALQDADVPAGINGHGVAGVNQLLAAATHRAAGCAGGQGKTGIVDGAGDVAGGYQFAGIGGGRRRYLACVAAGGRHIQRGGVGFQLTVGVFGDGGAVGIHRQIVHGGAGGGIGAGGYGYGFVAGFDFGFSRRRCCY